MSILTTLSAFETYKTAFQVLGALQMTSFMWPEQPQVQDCATYDFIIIGGGSAGCVVANRLTEIEDISVLVIEAGGNPPVQSVFPGLSTFLKLSDVDWKYYGEKDGRTHQHHKEKAAEITRGKVLGGSSSVNFMVYTRGNYHDYNKWAYLTNDTTWKWENVLPYFLKSEALEEPARLNTTERYYHSNNGYLGVTAPHSEDVLKYLLAHEEIGNKVVNDINGNDPQGYTESMSTIANGVRQSTAQSFIVPIGNRKNLHVLRNTLVTRILFDDNKCATGVEAQLENNVSMTFKAKKEVIVSGGVINSPQLLMLSGIGPKRHLESMNIQVISDLPVGQNLQDHPFTVIAHRMNTPLLKSEPVNPHAFSFPIIVGFKSLDKGQRYPDYEDLSLVFKKPDLLVYFCSIIYGFDNKMCQNVVDLSKNQEVLYTSISLLSPESRGEILLRSTDPKEPPRIYPAYFSSDTDLDNQVEYIHDFLKLQRSTLFNAGGAELIVPTVCGCNNWPRNSKQFWRCFILCCSTSGYHFVGTCSMGTVVDSRLRVFGVNKLRVIDASVMPTVPGAHTYAPTVMVAEKAADLIKKDHFAYL